MTPNDDTRDEELLARYRRAGAESPGPSEAVRAAILTESRRVAEQLAKQTPRDNFDVSRPAANDARWKITAFGTAGAALLAALLFAPRYWESAPPAQVSTAPPAPASAAIQVQDKAEARARSSSESDSPQEIVVMQAKRKNASSDAAPSPIAATPAPTPPPSVAQNYAPTTNSISALAAAPAAPAARVRAPTLSGQAAENSILGGYRADSALKAATLDSAVAQGDLAQAALLLDKGAVIDARDEAGRTPLMLAVTEGRLEVVRLLLARGADPNAADNAGHTPLQQATKRNLQDVAALLQQAGAH